MEIITLLVNQSKEYIITQMTLKITKHSSHTLIYISLHPGLGSTLIS